MAKDYIADALSAPSLDHLFPNMSEFDKSVSSWPWLRREISHAYRADKRNPIVGFINRDEASIVYSNARLFAGKAGVEVGAWRGWSTVHLLAAGLSPLHVIEPLLADPDWGAEFAATVAVAGGGGAAILVPEKSPEGVERLGASGVRWSFAFIDGDHDGEAPARDATVVSRFLEPTAMVLFHDLVSPHVAKGLRVFEAQGWNIMAYQTAQMVGVAWRGEVAPVAHKPDPSQNWNVPEHLKGIPISGVSAR
jgi:hypothetical protein